MWRLSGGLLRWLSGLRHRIVRRLTRAGLLAMGVLMLSAAMGLDTERTLAFQVFTFTLVALLIAMLGALRLGGRFRAERVLPPFASVGEPLRYRIVVSNESPRSQRGLHVLDELVDPRPSIADLVARRTGHGSVLRAWRPLLALRAWRALLALRPVVEPVGARLPELPAAGDAVVQLEFTPRRRGAVMLSAVTIWRPDPLGLVRALRVLKAPATLVVLPRRYPVPQLRLPGTRQYQQGGVTLVSSVGDSQEFQGLRDYRPGDPLQRIHWKSFARSGRPIVREYESEFFERHALVLDTFVAVEDDVFEEAVAIAASFACTIETQESLLDLMFVGHESYRYTAGRGQLQVARLLEVLAHVQVCADRSIDVLRVAILERRESLSSAIVVLLAWDESRRALVESLQATGLELLVLVVVPAGVEIRAAGVHPVVLGRVEEGLAALARAGL
ncbi:MAG: hypothetical protein ACI8W7_003862 [Gammaproteobacteria bacterium]